MTWIEVIDIDEATGDLKKLYSSLKSPEGHVDNVMKVHSLRPRTMRGHLALYRSTLHSEPNELDKRERELVAVTVGTLNGCEYCVAHHGTGLADIVGSQQEAIRLTKSAVEGGDGLTPRERAFVDYAIKLTLRPAEMIEADLVPLRDVGLSDAGILDLNQIVAYFNYVTRSLQGLGVRTDGEPLGYHSVDGEVKRYSD